MKKFFIAMAVLLLLCGCEKDTETTAEISETSLSVTTAKETETVAETTSEAEVTAAEKTAVTAVETTVPEETEAEETAAKFEYMKNENLLLGFLAYLQKTEPSNGVYYVFDHGNSFDQYDFFYDFKIDGYSYQHRGDGSYNVRLTCSDSTCDLFPNGDSYWYFKPGKFCRYEELDEIVPDFEFYDKFKDMPNYETISTAFWAACCFTEAAEYDSITKEADSEWFAQVHRPNVHWFYHNSPYIDSIIHEDYSVYPDDLRAVIKNLYNITMPEDVFDNLRFEENGSIFSYCGHGGSWYYNAIAGYDDRENEISVTVNFYGDEMYFYPVVQSEYTFSKNDDGNITLQNVEKIFDNGYEPASGSI